LAQPHLLTVGQGAESLRAGKVIAYPTEAVYGLGCNPFDEAAVRRILELKKRHPDAGLILIAEAFERFSGFVRPVSDEQLSVAMASWPGPVTWLFPRAPSVPDWLAGNHSTIAVRVTAHAVSRALCSSFEGAIVSTSANPATAPPATTPQQVADYFGDRIDGIVDGPLGGAGRPSEIRDLATQAIVRAG